MALTQRQQADRELAEKIRLENEFIPQLINLFNRVIDDFYQSMADIGIPPAMTTWQSFFEDLLLSHYQTTGDIFSHVTRDRFGVEFSEEEQHTVDLALSMLFGQMASTSAGFITQTNEDQAQEAVTRAQTQETIDMETTGKPYDAATRANVATNIFGTLALGRVTTIAIAETQTPAEAAKNIEADVFSYETPQIITGIPTPIIESTKTWMSRRDDLVRKTHVIADGQTVKVGEFFIVGGFEMAFPGDRSAPIEEWINCRCVAIYDWENEVMRKRGIE